MGRQMGRLSEDHYSDHQVGRFSLDLQVGRFSLDLQVGRFSLDLQVG
jgi:hypothetical protein